MLPYWLLFLAPALAALDGKPRYGAPRRLSREPGWVFALLGLIVFVGLRYEVGGDWFNYLGHLTEQVPYMNLADVLNSSEPGYWLVNAVVVHSGGGLVAVNLISAVFFSIGLVVFCRHTPRPWLALTVAVPYLILVVAMGYTRQGVALGFEMLGLIALSRRQTFWFVFWIMLGATFHRTAIVLLPLAAFVQTRPRFIAFLFVVAGLYLGYQALLSKDIDKLITHYVDASYQSSGALIRLTMNMLPAALFLLFRKRLVMTPLERHLWTLFSLVSVLMFLAFFFTSASTALDRLALYCLPLQLMVLSHVPDIFGRRGRRNTAIVMLILLYCALILFVWLSFANNAYAWLPYRMSIFTDTGGAA